MAKGTGLIGNFKGKVGNMVGYNLKDSNNKQTQGIRVYQPVVRNPKSYAQAQQRCIMKPINDFYRALKPVISRGQEGKAYGNASRLAWLKNVMKDFNGPWLVKGSTEVWPIACPITKGSLPKVNISIDSETGILFEGSTLAGAAPTTIAQLFAAVKTFYPSLQEGDQLTIVSLVTSGGNTNDNVVSFVLTTDDTTAVSGFSSVGGVLAFGVDAGSNGLVSGAVIVSREGQNGEHLRSPQSVIFDSALANKDVYKSATAQEEAIRSYMAAGANTDWPQEALEG